jgi:hypothetical protein
VEAGCSEQKDDLRLKGMKIFLGMGMDSQITDLRIMAGLVRGPNLLAAFR